MIDWNVLLAATIAAAPGLFALALAWRKSRAEKEKVEADAAATLVSSAVDLAGAKDVIIDDLRKRVSALEGAVEEGKRDRAELHQLIDELAELMRTGKEYTLLLWDTITKAGRTVPKPPDEILEKNWPEQVKGGRK